LTAGCSSGFDGGRLLDIKGVESLTGVTRKVVDSVGVVDDVHVVVVDVRLLNVFFAWEASLFGLKDKVGETGEHGTGIV
jgi:hypothetical protein